MQRVSGSDKVEEQLGVLYVCMCMCVYISVSMLVCAVLITCFACISCNSVALLGNDTTVVPRPLGEHVCVH